MELLTAQEHDCLSHLARAANLLRKITMADTGTYPHDWEEAAAAIHVLQRMVLSQAAGRAYPQRYRLLGNPQPLPAAQAAAPPAVVGALLERARAMHEDDPSRTVDGWLEYLREALTEQKVGQPGLGPWATEPWNG